MTASAKERLDEERITGLKLANAELQGELLRKVNVEANWTDWFAEWRSQIEAIPAKLASKAKFSATQMAAVRKELDGMVTASEAFLKRQARNPRSVKTPHTAKMDRTGKLQTRRVAGKVSESKRGAR